MIPVRAALKFPLNQVIERKFSIFLARPFTIRGFWITSVNVVSIEKGFTCIPSVLSEFLR